jgi:glycerophosphoryl diester phosphodiesterase
MARHLAFDRPIAHRGLHDRAMGIIENSWPAFAAAIDRNFAIECDVQLSRDGVPVVFHDSRLERLTGLDGAVGDMTAAELGATPLLGSANGDTPQRLSDVLARVAGRVLLAVELKHQTTAAMQETLASEATRLAAGYDGALALESFDPHLLTALRRHGYKGPLGIIVDDHGKAEYAHLTAGDRLVLTHLLHWPRTRFSFISCYHGALQLPAVRLFRALGMPVTAWTIHSPGERDGIAAHADQIVFEGFDPDRD